MQMHTNDNIDARLSDKLSTWKEMEFTLAGSRLTRGQRIAKGKIKRQSARAVRHSAAIVIREELDTIESEVVSVWDADLSSEEVK